MSFGNRRNLQKEESGAVLIVVALTIIVIFGMTVLVIDVGGLLLSRRGMVQAADSAALAAAQQCARKLSGATAKADEYAKGNHSEATRVGELQFSGGCESAPGGSVTVEYQVAQDLYFAPVLGLADKMDVAADSTAIWGSSKTADIVPVVFSSDGGNFPCAVHIGDQECAVTYDNSNQPITNTWGFVDVTAPGWPADVNGNVENRNCPQNNANQLDEWLGTPLKLSLVANPTWACTIGGQGGTAGGNNDLSEALENLDDDPDKIWYFPIADTSLISGTNKTLPIVGFIAMKIKKVYLDQNDPEAWGTPAVPGGPTDCPSMPIDFTFEEQPPGVLTYDLTTAIQACDPLGPVIEPPVIKRDPGNATFDEGTDFEYDPVTDVITWTFSKPPANETEDVRIYVSYDKPDIPATQGKCTPPPQSVANSFCFLLGTVGDIISGSDPDPTLPAVGNVKSIRLCDPEIEPALCPN